MLHTGLTIFAAFPATSEYFWFYQKVLQVPTRSNKPVAMIEVICNDRVGKKVRVKCNEDDTIGDLKKLIAAQVGTRPEKIR